MTAADLVNAWMNELLDTEGVLRWCREHQVPLTETLHAATPLIPTHQRRQWCADALVLVDPAEMVFPEAPEQTYSGAYPGCLQWDLSPAEAEHLLAARQQAYR